MAEQDSLRFKVAVIATDGVEESELLRPIETLKNKGAQVDLISPKSGDLQTFRHLRPSSRVPVDRALEGTSFMEYDALVLPGGALSADALRSDPRVLAFVREMHGAGRPIAAICHAPWILISAGLVDDAILTSYHSIRDDVRNAGGNWVDQEVVVFRNWITSREPKDLPAFNRELLKMLSQLAPSVVRIAESA